MKNNLSKKLDIEQLLETLSTAIKSSVQSYHPQKHGLDPDDLVQEIRIRLWKIFESDKKIHNYSSYIKRVVNSIIIDQIRSSRRHEKIIDLEKQRNSGEPKKMEVLLETREKVLSALDSLKESRRRVVRWHYFGLTTAEISKLLNIEEDKIKNLLYRGIMDLKNTLKTRGVDYED